MLNNDTNKSNLKPHVILITLDDVGYELFVENIDVLPNLKALKAQSAFFENAFSIGPTTFLSFPGIIGSVYPYHFGIGIDKNVTTISSILKNHGYNTAFFNEANAFLAPIFGYCKDIDHQNHFITLSHVINERKLNDKFLNTEQPNLVKSNKFNSLIREFALTHFSEAAIKLAKDIILVLRFLRLYWSHNAENIQERNRLFMEFRNKILEFIGNGFENPQFLWIHTIINHAPYVPPEDSRKFTMKEIDYLNYRAVSAFVNRKICGKIRELYIESLKKTDQFIGEILEALKEKELIDNCIIIITADHGEEFMEEGSFSHSPNSSSDRLLHVPLIFYWKELVTQDIKVPVSTIDIVPTMCDLLNINIPESSRGLSLKEVLLSNDRAIEKVRELVRRPLFSEGWEISRVLDRSPGYHSFRIIFTVRKDQYKLKMVRLQRSGNKVSEKLELNNWITHEKLDVKNNRLIVEELLYHLYEHIYKEGIFSSNLYENSEKERIKRTLRRLKGKV